MIIEAMEIAGHTLAAGNTPTEVIAWIVIPVVVFLLGAIAAGIRGAIRFAQYMVRSEEAQASIATTNTSIDSKLSAYMAKTDDHLVRHDQEIAILKFAAESQRNGHRPS